MQRTFGAVNCEVYRNSSGNAKTPPLVCRGEAFFMAQTNMDRATSVGNHEARMCFPNKEQSFNQKGDL